MSRKGAEIFRKQKQKAIDLLLNESKVTGATGSVYVGTFGAKYGGGMKSFSYPTSHDTNDFTKPTGKGGKKKWPIT